jgi:hypothetical protein
MIFFGKPVPTFPDHACYFKASWFPAAGSSPAAARTADASSDANYKEKKRKSAVHRVLP